MVYRYALQEMSKEIIQKEGNSYRTKTHVVKEYQKSNKGR